MARHPVQHPVAFSVDAGGNVLPWTFSGQRTWRSPIALPDVVYAYAACNDRRWVIGKTPSAAFRVATC